jgi:hypothetical protein
MMRLSFLVVSILVLAAIPTIANATHSPGKGPKRDLVVGSARFPVVAAHVRINAKSGPSGQNPRGHFFLRQGGFQFRGSVTCVLVVGNRASVGGRVTRSSGAGGPSVGSGFIQVIEDNGEPGRNDRSHTLFVASPPMVCPAPTMPFFVVARGNYVVHDGI